MESKILQAALEAQKNGNFLDWYNTMSSENKKLFEAELHKVIDYCLEIYKQLPDEVRQILESEQNGKQGN